MKSKILLAAILSALGSPLLHATQINGTIDFSSIPGKPVRLFGGSNRFLTATGLDFPTGPNAQIDDATGAFAGETGKATFNDFSFSAGASPLWVLKDGDFWFTLDPAPTITRGAHFMVVDGVGTVHGPGFEPTPGTFTFTTQGLRHRLSFSWSATDEAVPTPDGGATAILLGAGLLGLGAFAARKSAQIA